MQRRYSKKALLVALIYLILVAFLFLNSRLCNITWCATLLPYFVMPWIGVMNALGIPATLFGPFVPSLISTAIAGTVNAVVIYFIMKGIGRK